MAQYVHNISNIYNIVKGGIYTLIIMLMIMKLHSAKVVILI